MLHNRKKLREGDRKKLTLYLQYKLLRPNPPATHQIYVTLL